MGFYSQCFPLKGALKLTTIRTNCACRHRWRLETRLDNAALRGPRPLFYSLPFPNAFLTKSEQNLQPKDISKFI
jgi:hypothetical protein